jgi:hypothetical protein
VARPTVTTVASSRMPAINPRIAGFTCAPLWSKGVVPNAWV